MADSVKRRYERLSDKCTRLAGECEALAAQARRRNGAAEQAILNAAANLHDAAAMPMGTKAGAR